MLEFYYTNHRGETRLRTVDPIEIRWMEDPVIAHLTGFFLRAFEFEKNEDRYFLLERCRWINDDIYQFNFKVTL